MISDTFNNHCLASFNGNLDHFLELPFLLFVILLFQKDQVASFFAMSFQPQDALHLDIEKQTESFGL